MHRRKLIVRRFGVLSFGLGYFEDGAWVDHLAAPHGTTDPDAADIAAIHAWLDCCGERAHTPFAAIAVETAATNGARPDRVAAASRSASS
jgi:hypothetical protein